MRFSIYLYAASTLLATNALPMTLRSVVDNIPNATSANLNDAAKPTPPPWRRASTVTDPELRVAQPTPPPWKRVLEFAAPAMSGGPHTEEAPGWRRAGSALEVIERDA
ncbi:hypothetical protein R3P38DRAFT_3176651 [Favolaschia claudopus]|uniref:Uncharacterized protein n=1 Tax=Favolaschia claudopus TaxID=2862362 RepID=A0AAW0CW11_9AGAR